MSDEAAAADRPDHGYTVVVNGQPKAVKSLVVSYDQVVELAFPGSSADPNTTYIVTYRHADQAKRDGTLVEGEMVHLKTEGTIFDVTRTTKS
jgi:hypothetical protein